MFGHAMPDACLQPSVLFAWDGVLGCHRPIHEVVKRVVQAGLLSLAGLGVIDILIARHTRARYFFLHVVANLVISLLCLPDVWWIAHDPLQALRSHQTIHWPTAIVFSIHIYHVLFFKHLQWIDWLHHIIMVAVGAPLLIAGETGPLMNFNNFWMCGIPGGVDYCMLFCVKQGWMKPLDEKRHNTVINVWVRAPFLVCTGTLVFLQGHMQTTDHIPTYVRFIRYFLMFLACWNALFFMERVVGNFHVCEYKEKLEKKKARDEKILKDLARLPASQLLGKEDTEDEDPYETEEHLSAGLFPRRVLSKQDLQISPYVGLTSWNCSAAC
ncbi:hypothetical protein T492DRAFT_1150349 [Pavlovales sp. CCMP2436]|nr:hypothetical protein T492DRAFT_1150349 [Pavlovales sp. CCMP2436]